MITTHEQLAEAGTIPVVGLPPDTVVERMPLADGGVFEVAVVVKHSDLENVDMCNDLEVAHSAVVNFGHQHVAVYLRNVHLLIYSLNT